MIHKKSEKGQTSMEFIVVAPLVFGAIFLILGSALGWFTHALGSALALEGAAREAISPGSGFSLIDGSMVPGQLSPGYAGTIENEGKTGKVFTVTGTFHIPLSPLGFSLDADLTSAAVAPVWEFTP